MSKHKYDLSLKFELEGRFLGFVAKDGVKIKHLCLMTSTGKYTVKLSKEIRRSLLPTLIEGEWIRVSGWQTRGNKTKPSKLKAEQVNLAKPNSTKEQPVVNTLALTPQKSKDCILVCQKSDCCKRGGRIVFEVLQEALSDRNLGDQVVLKATGCMKRCKAGPNIVMPDKTRYSQISPAELPNILDRHLSAQPEAKPNLLEQSINQSIKKPD